MKKDGFFERFNYNTQYRKRTLAAGKNPTLGEGEGWSRGISKLSSFDWQVKLGKDGIDESLDYLPLMVSEIREKWNNGWME